MESIRTRSCKKNTQDWFDYTRQDGIRRFTTKGDVSH